MRVTVPVQYRAAQFQDSGRRTHPRGVRRGRRGAFRRRGRKGAIEIPPKKWRALLADADVAEVRVSAWSAAEPEGVRYAPFHIIVSPEPIDERIAYA